MKRLLSLLSFVCLFVLGSYATIVVEKLWENTTDAPTNAKVCCGWDGVLYAKNYSGGVIYAYSATGRTTFASEGNSPWGVAMDEAGNMVSRTEASYYTTSPGKMNIYVKGSTTAIPITFSGISGRTDYITADGDFTSSDGGKVYFYPNGSTEIKYVLIQNANASSKTATVSVGTLATGQSAGNSESYVLKGSARGTMAHIRTAARKIIGGTIPTLTNVNNNATGTAIMTIKTAADAAQEIWAYPTSNTKATFNVRNITTSANVAAATGTGFYIGSSDQATGSNSVWMSTQKISDYCYYLYVIAGNNATACFRVYENAPANLAQAVAGKTIRRSILNNGSLFVLAIDDAKEPYLYKVNPETQAIEAVIPTTGIRNQYDLTCSSGITTMPLADIAFTEDDVLIGCTSEKVTYTGDAGTHYVYKWTSYDSAPTQFCDSKTNKASGNFGTAVTGTALTYIGTSTTGKAIVLAETTGTSGEYRFVVYNVTNGTHQSSIYNRSVTSGGTSTITASTIGLAPHLLASPLSGDFILSGSNTYPIEVSIVANDAVATYNRATSLAAPSVGSSFFTADEHKYMTVPSATDVKIYDVTSGLGSASQVASMPYNSSTATYRAAFGFKDGSNYSAYLMVDDKIVSLPILANNITLDESNIYLTVDGTFTLTPTITPTEAQDNTITWTSGNYSIATVSSTGVVTGVAIGSTTITATVDGHSASCTVNVTNPMHGSYKVGGAEADYTSLFAACNDINSRSLSDDVTLLICADLTEPKNIGLVNTTEHTVTIRPDADVDRTIRFTYNSDNTGPSGAFVIGNKTENIDWAGTATRNIEINGLAASDGATHKITFITPIGFGATAGPIVIYGAVTNTAIRNCRIINELTGTAFCITLRNNQPTGISSTSDDYPDGIVIENNYLATPNAGNGQAIYLNGSKAATTGPSNTHILNNEIHASVRGIFLNKMTNVTITGNIIHMEHGGGYNAAGIMATSSTGSIQIKKNQILSLATDNTDDGLGLIGISAESGGNWDIENNLITGFKAFANNQVGRLIGIKATVAPSSLKIQHNTLFMPTLGHAITNSLVNTNPVTLLHISGGSPIVKNNIFISMEENTVNSLIRGSIPATFTGNVLYSAGGNGVVVDNSTDAATTYNDLSDNLKANNKHLRVPFSETYKISETFWEHPALAVTPISGIDKDIEGNDRHATAYAGCYEPSDWSKTMLTFDQTLNTNGALINDHDGETVNVLLKRQFQADGGWYTLALPFDATDAQLEEMFGEGYEVYVLQDARWKTNTDMYLNFVPQSVIQAGKPCLIKPSEDVTDDLYFYGVTINKVEPEISAPPVVNMVGLYDKQNVPLNDNNYYIGNSNLLYEYNETYQLTNGFRAYFHFNFPSGSQAPVRLRVVFNEDTVTELEDLPEENNTTPAVQKMIRDGQLIIIRDGKEYNVQGQVIR